MIRRIGKFWTKEFIDLVLSDCIDNIGIFEASRKYDVSPITISSWFRARKLKRPFHYKYEKIKGEKWYPVPNYEGYYEFSNHLRVKSLARKSNGWKERILTYKKASRLYYFVYLSKNNINENYPIHILSATIFVPNPHNFPEVNHKNGNKLDNRPKNLEWGTHGDNIRHAYKTGLINHGKFGMNAKSKKIGRFKDGVLIKEYSCANEAEADGFWASNIWKAINVTGSPHKGYIWKYL